MADTPDERRRLLRMALSIGFSTAPFGAAFGVACVQAGPAWWEAMGFSPLVFGGSAQSAVVSVLGQGAWSLRPSQPEACSLSRHWRSDCCWLHTWADRFVPVRRPPGPDVCGRGWRRPSF